MNRFINPNRRINPDAKMKAHIKTWHDYYKAKVGIEYQYSPKDFANLKFLLRKLDNEKVTLADYLDNIKSEWHLANMSIPLFNSHFNTLIRPNEDNKPSFPNHYDRKFEQTLEQDKLPAYWQHLTALGFKKGYSQGAGSIWTK